MTKAESKPDPTDTGFVNRSRPIIRGLFCAEDEIMGGFYNPYARSVAADSAPIQPQQPASAAPRADKDVNPFSRSAGK